MGVERFYHFNLFYLINIIDFIVTIPIITIITMKVEWPEFAACLAEMMKGEEEETAYRECFRFFLHCFSSKTGSASEFFLLSFLQLIQGVQQRWWGLYTCWRDEVCLESGNLCLYLPPLHQSHDDLGVLHGGGGGDVGGGRQERGWGDQLLGVQMHDGSKPNSLVAPAIFSPTVGNLKKVFTIKDEQEKKWKLWWGRIPFPWNSSDAMSSGNYQRMNRVSAVLR